ncbi:sensor histidine kinase [Paenibacillus sp. YIM B09110]|uniref:sensor histidine kinase n=1 Tax=Paenibacillus sp. YIM B09110 TaxID=3126102 RepID=UPI00301CED3E
MRSVKALLAEFKGMRIIHKMIIGYIVIICIPFIIFGLVFYNLIVQNVLDEYSSGRQKFLEQSNRNLKVSLAQSEAAIKLFQNNDNITEYLARKNLTDADMVFTYLKEIEPTIVYAVSGNPLIGRLSIFNNNEEQLQLPPDIQSISQLKQNIADTQRWAELRSIAPGQGKWFYNSGSKDEFPSFNYYSRIFNNQYSQELGLIEIALKPDAVRQFYETVILAEGSSYVFVDQSAKLVYRSDNFPEDPKLASGIGKLVESDDEYIYLSDKKVLLNRIHIESFGLDSVLVTPVHSLFNGMEGREGLYIGVGLLLLIALSLIYYKFAASMAKRVIRLTKHINRLNPGRPTTFKGETGNDEIGGLIQSYNAMIELNNELFHKAHRLEMMKKDAEYKMLEAQIRPHFLYNTLESMRMLAKINGDHQVADMAYTLGELLRYSITKKNPVTLQDEVVHLQRYISIQKIRMESRLVFEYEDNGVDLGSLVCPKFLLQPIVENCIIHGISGLRRTGIVRLEITRGERIMTITISDNGVGIPEDELWKLRARLDSPMLEIEGGIGLHNVNERIKAFYGEGSGLSVTSHVDKGSTFKLILLAKGGEKDD